MKKYIFIFFVIGLQAIVLRAQVISPLQTGHYVEAFINFRDYTKPTHGMYFLLYNSYSWGNSFIDQNGNKLTDIKLSELDSSFPDINFNTKTCSFSSTLLIYWASKFHILGAVYEPLVTLPGFSYSNSQSFGEIHYGSGDSTHSFYQSGTTSGFGDLFVQPVGLAWGGKLFDFMFTYGFYVPTGRFENGGDNNTGMGFWTNQFQAFSYLYPAKGQSTALMLALTWEINGKIKGTDVVPGQRLTLEWGISQYFTDRLEVYIQGGNNWQVSDDKGDEVWWDASVHDRKSTVAFAVNYWVVADKLYLGLKYGFDFALQQRFKKNLTMFNIIYAPGILAGKKK